MRRYCSRAGAARHGCGHRRRRRGGHGGGPRARPAPTAAYRAARRRSDDVGTGTSKAQHRHPAHRLRRVTPGPLESHASSRGATHCSPGTPDECGIAVERHRRAARRVGGRPARPRCRGPGREGPSPTVTARPAHRSGVEELYDREPHLGPGALGALEVPGESVVDPWSPDDRLRPRQAVAGGCPTCTWARPCTDVAPAGGEAHVLRTSRGELRPRAGWSTPPACTPTSSTGCSASRRSR